MSAVKWIKITTDMFDNRKIKHLRRLPDGNNIILIWVMLLTMAGRCNAAGMIYLTENIPYTSKMLADELDFEENTVQLALRAMEQLGMIVSDNGFISIAGWKEYQNVEGMDRIREQTRQRVAQHRKRQKMIENDNCNVTCNVTIIILNHFLPFSMLSDSLSGLLSYSVHTLNILVFFPSSNRNEPVITDNHAKLLHGPQSKLNCIFFEVQFIRKHLRRIWDILSQINHSSCITPSGHSQQHDPYENDVIPIWKPS